MKKKQITVTKPFLPGLSEFIPYLERIWESEWLTNSGPMHQELETELARFLGVPHVCLFNNATNALMVALRALDVEGEVITTPYSFVATSHTIALNGCTPVFVDLDPLTLNMDASKIEAVITENTTAILPVHCYGIPCDVHAIDAVAKRHNLKVIYDAAHAFASEYEDSSLLNHGDLAVVSFHATKVFNTFEGGAIICKTEQMKNKIDLLKNFGIESETSVKYVGMNGKMNEVSAAFGLLQLKHIESAIEERRKIADLYIREIGQVPGIRLLLKDLDPTNCSYFPIVIEDDYPMSRDELYSQLKEQGVMTRRYFYPLLSDLPMYRDIPSASRQHLPVASAAAERILCLPIYPGLEETDQFIIINSIREKSHANAK